jgi:excisionase family DNA binding protein
VTTASPRSRRDWRTKARLRPRELAEVASVSLRTVWRKIHSGEIESYTSGGCRFIPIRAALEFAGEDDLAPEPGSVSARARATVAELRSGVR